MMFSDTVAQERIEANRTALDSGLEIVRSLNGISCFFQDSPLSKDYRPVSFKWDALTEGTKQELVQVLRRVQEDYRAELRKLSGPIQDYILSL